MRELGARSGVLRGVKVNSDQMSEMEAPDAGHQQPDDVAAPQIGVVLHDADARGRS